MVLILCASASAVGAPVDPVRVEGAVHEELSSSRYQRTHPADLGTEAPQPGTWWNPATRDPPRQRTTGPSPETETRDTSRDGFWRLGSPGSGLVSALLWCFLAIVTIGIALFLYAALRTGRQVPKTRVIEGSVPPPAAPPAPGVSGLDLDALDALAAAGRFDEAVHGLLTATLVALRRSGTLLVADDLTSRELLEAPACPGSLRPPLRVLVQHVERSRYALRPLDRESWETCRSHFVAMATQRTSGAS